MTLRPDVKEIYLKRFLSVQPQRFYDFKMLYNYASLLLCDDPSSKKRLDDGLTAFLRPLENKGVLPSLDYVLILMDGMTEKGKSVILVKNRYLRRRVKLIDLIISLSKFNELVLTLVREKAHNIRILNPDVLV